MKNEIKMNFKWLIFAGIEATTLLGSPVRLGAWNTYLPKEVLYLSEVIIVI